jgi:hypothetical protein
MLKRLHDRISEMPLLFTTVGILADYRCQLLDNAKQLFAANIVAHKKLSSSFGPLKHLPST